MKATRLFAARSRVAPYQWVHFFASALAVQMCGVPKEEIQEVEILYRDENLQATEGVSYYAFMNIVEGEFEFIFSDLLSLKVCSPDFFKSSIARGEGRIVRVRVKSL